MKFFRKLIGKTNRIEKIYIYAFVASIVAGIIYGIVDTDYYKCCEKILTTEANFATIFIPNFFLSALNLISGGISNFFVNFHSFSIISSSLHAQGLLFLLPFFFLHGGFELLGMMFFGLSGLSLFERKILKRKSLLKIKHLLVFGTIFLFTGFLVEIGLFLL